MNAHVNTEELIKLLNDNHADVERKAAENEKKLEAQVNDLKSSLNGVSSQMTEIEQRMARRPGPSGATEIKSIGAQVIASEKLKAFAKEGGRGKVTVDGLIETKTVNTITSGSLIAPDYRPDIVGMPQRKLVIRDIVASGTTESNLIEYVQQTARQLNAAPVAEGNLKPQSDGTFALVTAPVRTIAHWMNASRQVLDDLSLLRSFIDGEIEYGVNLAEENQLLNGDGTGQNLLGIIPQANAFSAAFSITGETQFDRLALAILQVELNLFPCDAIVVNPTDWRKMQLLKDGMGRYIGGGPFASTLPNVWNLPVVTSLAMTAGNFLCGSFKFGAQLFDRQQVAVQVSTENQDNFIRNLCTVLGEERIAFAVKRPAAFVYGAFPTS